MSDTVMIVVRVPKREMQLLERVAEVCGVSVQQFVLDAALKRASELSDTSRP